MHKLLLIFGLVIVLLKWSICVAQDMPGLIDETKLNEDWRWVQFTTESGLPSNHLLSLVEASNGIIWVATTSGLAWYDGFRWNPIDSSHGLPPRRVRLMTIGSNDSLVVVTEDGFMYHGGIRGFHRMEIGWSVGEAVAFGDKVIIHHSGQLLLCGEHDVDIFAPLPTGYEGFSENQSLWVTKGRSLWFNSQGGLFRWDGQSWKLKIQSHDRDCMINCLVEDKKGNGIFSIGMPFAQRGVWEWHHNAKPRVNPVTRGNWIKSMDINDRGDVIAVEQSSEIFQRRNNVWSKINSVPLPMRDVEFVAFRKNGDLWVGTKKGLFLFKQYALLWEYYRSSAPNRNRIHEIVRAIDGSLWLGTADGLEVHRPNHKTEFISHILGKPIYEITGIAEDSKGQIWVSSGSAFDGTYRWDGAVWSYFRIDTNVNWLKIHKIRKDRQGRLWFLGLSQGTNIASTEEPGAYLYDNGSFIRWSTENGLLSGHVYAFAEGSDGALWFGTQKGLSQWKMGKWTHWRTDHDLPFTRIFTLAVDHGDRVWFADRVNGLGSIDQNGKIEILTTKNGLLDDHVWDLALDARGCLWISTEGGLNCYDQGKWKTYDIRSGLLTTDLWPVLPLRDTIYVGTQGKGLAVLNLRRSHQPTPKIYFDSPVVEENKVVIRVQPYAFWGELPPREILTRYSLNSGQWSSWSTVHDIILKDLISGDYSFRIQAQNPFGEFDPNGIIGYFTIAPPLYMLPDFYLPIGSLFLLIIFLGVEYLVRIKKYNREMRESEAKFRRLAESTFEGIVIHDQGEIREVNQNMTKMFGYSYQELKRRTLFDLVAPEVRDIIRDKIIILDGKPFETIGLRKDNSQIWCEMIVSSITSGGIISSVVAIRDISERKETEKKLLDYQEQLRSLASELSITEERERRRMSAFLHDTIGQVLAFCRIKLSAVQVTKSADHISKPLREIRDLVDQAIRDTRSLTFNLSPPILYEVGLEAAIESLVEQMQGQHDLHFQFFDDKAPKPLSNEFRIILYSAVRELLTNIVKHANAGTAKISIKRDHNRICVIVMDDGEGFNPSSIAKVGNKQGGFGLFNIREKIHHLGGTFAIESAPQKGTQVSLIAPLINNQSSITEENHEHKNYYSRRS